MGRRTYSTTKAVRVSVETQALDRMIARLEQQGVQAANDAVEEEARAQVAFAFDQWGVDTGAGRASLRVGAARRGDKFAVRVFSAYKPVRYQSWDGARPTFWQALVQRPLRKLLKQIAKRAAKALARETNHGR